MIGKCYTDCDLVFLDKDDQIIYNLSVDFFLLLLLELCHSRIAGYVRDDYTFCVIGFYFFFEFIYYK